MNRMYKWGYRNREVAEKFEVKRFSHSIGKFEDRLEKKALLNLLKVKASDTEYILEIACGTARITRFLAGNGFNVLGTDVSEFMVNEAKRWTAEEGIQGFMVCDAESLPFKNSVFDCVTSVRLTGHVPPEARVEILRETRRVSKKWVLMSFHNRYTITGVARKVILRFKGTDKTWHTLTYKGLRHEAELADLELVAVKPILGLVAETYMALLSIR